MGLEKANRPAFVNFLRAKYERFTGEVLVRSYPYYMLIDPSSVCGLRCPGCGTGADNAAKHSELARQPRRKKAVMSVELFDSLMEELGDYLFRVLFYNWGEPLLNKNLTYFVKKAKEREIHTDINTSLSFELSDQAIQDLLLSGIDEIAASIDGFCQEIYEIYRVGGDFEMAKNNLERLVAFRDRLGLNTKIIWNFLVFSFNEHEIEAARQYCDELGVSFSRKDGYIDIVKHPDWLPSYRKQELNRIDGHGGSSRATEKAVEVSSMDKTCAWHYCFSIVNADGSVSPCCAVYDQVYDFGKIELGTVSFAGVWNNNLFRKARGILASKKVKGLCDIKPVCEKCTMEAVKDQFTGYDYEVRSRFWELFSGSEPILGKAFSLLDSEDEFVEFYGISHSALDDPNGRTMGPRHYVEETNSMVAERRRVSNAASKLVQLGERLFSEGNHELALELLSLIAEVDPGNYANWTDLGVVLSSLGMLDKAEKCLEKAISLRPDFAPALQNLERLKNAVQKAIS